MDEFQEVDEINLVDLIFYWIKRWRCIVVCMTFFAIIMGVYRYQTTITDNRLKKEQQLQQHLAEQVEEEVVNVPVVFEDPLSSAISFAIIGMLGGICLACLVFSINYVMSGKLQSEDKFQEKFDMLLLGVIRKKESKKKWCGFLDRWICCLEEGPYAKIPRKEQIKISAINVQVAIHKNSNKKIKRVMLAGTITGDDIIEICEQLAGEIDDVIFSPYRQIIYHAEALKKLEYYEGILFIERKGESYEKLIRKERELAVRRGVEVLVTIVC